MIQICKKWNTRKNREFIYLMSFFVFLINIFELGCLSRFIFNVPCPFCGMSRAWISVLNLNFKKAFFFHPLFWLAPLYVMILANWINYNENGRLLVVLTGLYVLLFLYRTIFLYIP